MAIIQPLNLEQWLVFNLAGSIEIFTFIAIIFISALSARFKMPTGIFAVMLVLGGVMLADYIGGLYLILILLTGFASFSIIAEQFK